jgi:hypothetical protein
VGTRQVATGVVVLGLVAGIGFWLGSRWDEVPLPRFGRQCTVEAHGEVSLDTDQMANAATIAAVGVRLGMPDQAVVVALATALQESKLRNLPHLGGGNDHDSIGLFQQRPSQGWGAPQQLAQPGYAAERFYLALREVDGWEEMRLTDAAQRVQRSAYPEAYQQWADDADVLATALLGHAPGAVTCTVPENPPTRGEPAVTALGEALTRDWGARVTTDPGAAPAAAVRLAGAGAEAGPGLTVAATDPRAGWRYAHWLVSHAAGHGVTRVQFADLVWTAAQGGWSATDAALDHVHAEVAAG